MTTDKQKRDEFSMSQLTIERLAAKAERETRVWNGTHFVHPVEVLERKIVKAITEYDTWLRGEIEREVSKRRFTKINMQDAHNITDAIRTAGKEKV